MAINPETQYPGKIAPSTPAYPYGAARNITTPGDGSGTPWEAALVNDLFGWQQAILSQSGLVPSGSPETAETSQYLRGLLELTTRKFATVADMLAFVEPSKITVGAVVSTGGTFWRVVDNAAPAALENFEALTQVNIKDFGLTEGADIPQSVISEVSLYCRVKRRTAILSGVYTTSEDLVLDFNVNMGDCYITTDNTVVIGRTVNFVRDNINVIAPRVTAATKWPGTGTVGVKITSLTNSTVVVPYIGAGYDKGLQVLARGTGVVFNTVYLGYLDDNYTNFAIETEVYTPDPAFISFANENLFIGGHLGMKPQAAQDPNRVQLYGNDRDAGINGNYWLKTSLELPTFGAGQPTDKYLRFESSCAENFLIGVRTEGVGEMVFEDNSNNNHIEMGSQSTVSGVTVVESGASDNYIERMGRNGSARSFHQPMVFTNSLDVDRSIMDFVAPLGAGGVQNRSGTETTYSTRHLHDGVKYKQTSDSNDRVAISARSKTGLDVSRGSGNSSPASVGFSASTNAFASGVAFVFSESNMAQGLKESAAKINVVTAEVVAYRPSDGKKFVGSFKAVVSYEPGVSADYSVISETLIVHDNDFSTFTFSLGTGVGKGGVISPRIVVTDAVTAGGIMCEALFMLSSSNNISN